MQTHSLLNIVLLSFQTYIITKINANRNPKIMWLFPSLLYCMWAGPRKQKVGGGQCFLLIPTKICWGWTMKKRMRKMSKKKQKAKGTCPQCVITPTTHFQGSTAIWSNWSPYCTQLRPWVAGLLFFETLKAPSLALKVIRSRTRPQMPPFWSCLQLCVVVYALHLRHSFSSIPHLLCCEHDLRALDCFYSWAAAMLGNKTIAVSSASWFPNNL